MKRVCMFLVVCALLMPAACSAIPQMPHIFYGNVTASDGTHVEARVDGDIYNDYNPVAVYGNKYGEPGLYGQKLLVQGNISNGSTITFFVGGVNTGINYTYSPGAVTRLDLTTPVPTTIPTTTPTTVSTTSITTTPTTYYSGGGGGGGGSTWYIEPTTANTTVPTTAATTVITTVATPVVTTAIQTPAITTTVQTTVPTTIANNTTYTPGIVPSEPSNTWLIALGIGLIALVGIVAYVLRVDTLHG